MHTSIGRVPGILAHQYHPSPAAILTKTRQVSFRQVDSAELVNTEEVATYHPVCPDHSQGSVVETLAPVLPGRTWHVWMTMLLLGQGTKSWTICCPLRSQNVYGSGRTVRLGT